MRNADRAAIDQFHLVKTEFAQLVLGCLLSACSFLLLACGESGKEKNTSSNKFKRYYHQGEQLYLKHCANCHQKDGSGLGRLYPPLAQSDFMDQHFNEVLCLIRNGRQGELIVNEISYHHPMPANSSLTDLEIAEIATFVYNTWTHERGIVEVKEVSGILQQCPEVQ